MKSNHLIMSPTTLVRTATFSAVHRYWRPDWSEERNRGVFGEQTRRHGHDYRVEVAVEGPVDPDTGFLVDLGALDRVLADVVGALDNRDLNEVIPEVRDGEILPSTEELARWIWGRLEDRVPGDARLRRVRIEESDRLAAEVTPEDEGSAQEKFS